LTSTITRANDIRATTPRRPTQKPLTKLLGRRGLTPTLLLLTLATPRTETPSTSPIASTAATPTSTPTTATRAPTPANSPTAATTSTASTTSTAAPTTTPAATSTTTTATSTTPATLALAATALRTSRISNRDVYSSSRGVGGGKGGGGAPLKEGRARSATSSTYSNCTSLSCLEMLLEEVNSEGGGVKGEEVVLDRAKRVMEASDYEVHVLLFGMGFGAEISFRDSSVGSENGSSGVPLRTKTYDDDSDERFFGY
ncbi:unnamed protein product, partial [Closterium sp. NIES-54]